MSLRNQFHFCADKILARAGNCLIWSSMSEHKSKYWYVSIITNARFILQLIVNGNLHELLVTVRNTKMRGSTIPSQTLSLSRQRSCIASSWHPSRDSRNMKQCQWSRRCRSGWRTRSCTNSQMKTWGLNIFRKSLRRYVIVKVSEMNYGIREPVKNVLADFVR